MNWRVVLLVTVVVAVVLAGVGIAAATFGSDQVTVTETPSTDGARTEDQAVSPIEFPSSTTRQENVGSLVGESLPSQGVHWAVAPVRLRAPLRLETATVQFR